MHFCRVSNYRWRARIEDGLRVSRKDRGLTSVFMGQSGSGSGWVEPDRKKQKGSV